MRVRYALAVAFAASVAGLIALRDAGYVGGRTESGPLTIGLGGNAVGGGGRIGSTEGYGAMPSLDGEPVEIQSVKLGFVSPGLEFRAPRTTPRADAGCGVCTYPRDGGLFEGSVYDGEDDVVLGLRAIRPGVYYAVGLTTDYKRGQRRFRDDDDQLLCHAVGRRAQCDLGFTLPDARLAEVGGPSSRRRVTLTNLTRETFEVSDVQVPGATTVSTVPESVTLERGEAATFRLRLRGCRPATSLTAELDGDPVDVPLSASLRC